jgi:hypothetical protein
VCVWGRESGILIHLDPNNNTPHKNAKYTKSKLQLVIEEVRK